MTRPCFFEAKETILYFNLIFNKFHQKSILYQHLWKWAHEMKITKNTHQRVWCIYSQWSKEPNLDILHHIFVTYLIQLKSRNENTKWLFNWLEPAKNMAMQRTNVTTWKIQTEFRPFMWSHIIDFKLEFESKNLRIYLN